MSGNGRGFKEMANDEQILRTLVERIVEHLKPERIYLFGSKARGDAGPDSDFDLLVVVGNSSKPGYRRDIDAYRAVRDVPMAKDILV